MDEEKKKLVMIVVAIACIVLAVVITFATKEDGGSRRPTGPIHMLCVNPDCGVSFELSRDDYSEQLVANQPEMTMRGVPGRGMAGPSALTCSDCGEVSAYVATKCPECEASFIQGQAGDRQFPDRCPECDYSAMEGNSAE
jgi:hypothetical protein